MEGKECQEFDLRNCFEFWKELVIIYRFELYYRNYLRTHFDSLTYLLQPVEMDSIRPNSISIF